MRHEADRAASDVEGRTRELAPLNPGIDSKLADTTSWLSRSGTFATAIKWRRAP